MYILKNRRHQIGADKNIINKKLGTFSCRYFNKTKSNFDRLLKKMDNSDVMSSIFIDGIEI